MKIPGIFARFLLSAAAVFPICSNAQRFDQIIQAEDFSDTSGVSWPAIVFKSQDPRVALRHFSNNDWIKWDSVNFLNGEFDSLCIYYWSSWPQDLSGATVRARLDSPTGTVIATFSGLSGTGGFGYQPSSPKSTALTAATGLHTLYLTFSGGSDIMDLDKIRLAGNMVVQPSDAKTWWVDGTDGSDAVNDGLSEGRPFKTIRKAASMMRPGATCNIRQGIYRETVKPVYTGVSGAPMVFQAYNGENVVISGADPITGWTAGGVAGKSSIYKAIMRWDLGRYYNQLLIDGKMAWVARCPNVEEAYVPHPYLNWCGGAAGVINYAPWRGIADPITIATKVCFGTNGTSTRIDGNFPPFDMDIENNTSTTSGQYVLPAAFFGHPADFFKGGLISLHNYYWSTVGEITASSAPGATRAIINANAWNSVVTDGGGPGWISHVFGLLDSPNEWYRQDSTVYLWAPDGGDPSHHLVEAKRRTIGFDLRGKQYITLKGIRFLATSATLADASFCILDGCHFKYVNHFDVFDWYETGAGYFQCPWNPSNGYSGVYISGHDNVFQNGSVAVAAGSGIILSGRKNTVTNSHIRDCDYTVTYQAGILVSKRYVQDQTDALNMTVTHNTLKFCSRGNVQIAFASDPTTAGERTRIMYNDFGPAAFTTQETGSLACQGSQGTEVAYNWFHGTAGLNSGDIVMEYDFGARHYTVHHNVFWQGQTIVQGFKTGCHWTFDWNDTGTSATAPNAGGAMCFNNTVVDSSDVGHRDWDMDWPGYKKNNIMAMSDTAPWKFTDAKNRDYTLRTGSPAIDAGVVVPGWVETFNGTAPDLGAYEYGQPRWTAGADWQEQPWVYPPPPRASVGRTLYPGRSADMPRVRLLPGHLALDAPAGAAWHAAIYDARGVFVASHDQPQGGAMELSTRMLPAGIYIVRVSSMGARMTWKIWIR